MTAAQKHEVLSFLKKFKRRMGIDGLDIVPREVNLSDIAMLALTIDAVEEEVLSLTTDHYVSGPEADRDNVSGAPVWVFGKMIIDNEVYIKLTHNDDRNKAICVSFHVADRPMEYPYRKDDSDEQA